MNRIEKIKEFLEKTPNDNFLRHALALEYIKAGELQQAKELFREILAETPAYIGSYYHLAKLLAETGETQSAIECYEKGMTEAKKANDMHAYNELLSAYEDLIY